MLKNTQTVKVAILPNGLISVFDYGCKWTACYKFNDNRLEHHSGGTDHVDYRRAIARFLNVDERTYLAAAS